MSNAYGFQWLQAEHLIDAEGREAGDDYAMPSPSVTSSRPATNVEHKPDLEKQFDILAFLQAHRGSGCLAPSVIYDATGIDLDADANEKLVQMLQKNPKVRVELVPDPENPALTVSTYAYQAKYATVRERTSLLAQINRMTSGIPMRDLLDSYLTVLDDLQALITAGDVICISNTENRDKILFPRGGTFLVELDGLISIPSSSQSKQLQWKGGGKEAWPTNGSHSATVPNGVASNSAVGAQNRSVAPRRELYMVETDMDPCTQIRRGEAIQVCGQWFRVSSAVKDGPLSDQPVRAQAPLSVVSLADLSKKNDTDGYIRAFTAKYLPLDAPLSDTAIENLQAARQAREQLFKLSHGRSGGMAGQIFGSNAHASNPTALAKSLASTSSSTSFMRKRPKTTSYSSTTNHHQQGTIPKDALAQAATDPALALYSHARRHGCTLDVRDMYLATRKYVPESDEKLQAALIKYKLLEPGEQMRRPRLTKTGPNVDNDGKPKKRRYYERKNQRMTNQHLDGTKEGLALKRAAETQKHGKSVGDGGM
jgi:hypothetical protein